MQVPSRRCGIARVSSFVPPTAALLCAQARMAGCARPLVRASLSQLVAVLAYDGQPKLGAGKEPVTHAPEPTTAETLFLHSVTRP